MRKSGKEFKQFYDKSLLPILDKYNEIKIVFLKKARRRLYIFLAIIIASMFFSISAEAPIFLAAVFMLPLVHIAAFLGQITSINGSLSKNYKKRIFLPIFNFFYDEVTYLPKQKLKHSTIQKSRLIYPTPEYIDGEDYIRTLIGKNLVQFCELQASNVAPRKNPLFRGVFCVSTFNKHFKTNTILLSRKDISVRHLIGIGVKSVLKQGKVIKLEDPIFNEKFLIYAEDEVEARYILSPKLMKRIIDYKKKLGSNVSISFIENRVYLKIPLKKNLFDFSILRDFNNYEFIKNNAKYFIMFTDIVEDLDLDTRIWSK